MREILVGLAFLALAGCGYMPISSMLKLRQLDLMTADARQIRVAVQMPDALEVREDGAVLEIGAERPNPDENLQERFILEKIAGAAAADIPGVEVKPGFHLSVFRVAEADMARLTDLRGKIKAWKEQDPDGTKGSLSIGAAGCRRERLPEGALLVSTYLRTDNEDEFITMARNFDLRSAVPDSGAGLDLPPCGSGSGPSSPE